jgi:hypothetical protein
VRLLATLLAVALSSDYILLKTGQSRKFEGPAQDFRAASRDGRWVLATGIREDPCTQSLGCRVPVLAVYDVAGGRPVHSLDGPMSDYFYGGAFTADGAVTARTIHSRVRWAPAPGTVDWTPLSSAEKRELDGSERAARESGIVLSPDGTIGASVRKGEDHGVDVYPLPAHAPIRRIRIDFPEARMEYVRLMGEQFAEALAISYDNRWIAIGYGQIYGTDWGSSKAFVGVYSLRDGHRAAVVAGQEYSRNLFFELLRGGDGGPTAGIPLGHCIGFSPDGRWLYGTSKRLFAVDVSRLR